MFECTGCKARFQVTARVPAVREGVLYCPFCGTVHIKHEEEKTPEERRTEVQQAAQQGFKDTGYTR